ncbi:MAG: hypothetical protein KDK34_15815, partial [Leptospiraceae bacterium]|nr:hypothetical protein [Leptospiraceae bacterium]
ISKEYEKAKAGKDNNYLQYQNAGYGRLGALAGLYISHEVKKSQGFKDLTDSWKDRQQEMVANGNTTSENKSGNPAYNLLSSIVAHFSNNERRYNKIGAFLNPFSREGFGQYMHAMGLEMIGNYAMRNVAMNDKDIEIERSRLANLMDNAVTDNQRQMAALAMAQSGLFSEGEINGLFGASAQFWTGHLMANFGDAYAQGGRSAIDQLGSWGYDVGPLSAAVDRMEMQNQQRARSTQTPGTVDYIEQRLKENAMSAAKWWVYDLKKRGATIPAGKEEELVMIRYQELIESRDIRAEAQRIKARDGVQLNDINQYQVGAVFNHPDFGPVYVASNNGSEVVLQRK